MIGEVISNICIPSKRVNKIHKLAKYKREVPQVPEAHIFQLA
jgi:hypothetical protein